MIDNFNFSEEDKNTAKTYFDAADAVLIKAILNPELTLKDKINEDGEIDIKWISDATIIEKTYNKDGAAIEKPRPIIDLVQQGGGMWGIALLGYCYIMEKIGIRFYSHGGTSAGAINALFLSSISADIYKEAPIIKTTDNRGALKSEILTLIVSNMDFSSFMNRKGIVGKMQERLFKNFNSKFLPIIIGLLSIITIYGMYKISSIVIKGASEMNAGDSAYFSVIIAIYSILAFIFLLYILFTKVLGENFGLNTGEPFLVWVKDNLKKLNIYTTADLNKSLSETQLVRNSEPTSLKEKAVTMVFSQEQPKADTNISEANTDQKTVIAPEALEKFKSLSGEKPMLVENPKLVIITANLSHNRIVRFPKRAAEYWENPKLVHPAAFVRASMSLPFIFHTFIPNDANHYGETSIENKVKLKARFVDGGMLSNFPIREFHRTSNKPPSFPTFGVLLSQRPKIEF